jgi:DNA polymerase V
LRNSKHKIAWQALPLSFPSNPFSKSFTFFQIYYLIKLPIATSDIQKFHEAVQKMLAKLFRPNIRYHKCGIMLQRNTQNTRLQSDLLNAPDSEEIIALMKTLDSLNHRFGRETLKLGSSGLNPDWKTQARMKSAHFTTDWNDLLKVKS